MATSPTPITALPTPPSTTDPLNFDTRADAFLLALPTLRTETNTISTVNYNNTLEANNSATAAAASVTTATTQVSLAAAQVALATTQANNASSYADAAAASAGASIWVSGTTYAIGDVRYSPADARIYRRLTAGAGTTDPRDDSANWLLISNLLDQLGALAILTYFYN